MKKFRIPRKKKKQLKKTMSPLGYKIMIACARLMEAMQEYKKMANNLGITVPSGGTFLLDKGKEMIIPKSTMAMSSVGIEATEPFLSAPDINLEIFYNTDLEIKRPEEPIVKFNTPQA